ncbi:TRAP transporter substrate-binding protein [Thioclava indica]|uniref:ABC transporter substrate-binding protein n=1 Tax=Thioclava indica TaxID=1353528 RepID=A0A074JR16_9RHOB|nr:TRAP transporter substrate-binding protein [Thioclava indica]KEO58355.1 hypothetical protein DT23_16540 [Thioclava indica]
MKSNSIASMIAGVGLALASVFAAGHAEARTLRFSHTDNPGGSRDKAAHVFADKVKEYTKGELTVKVYPSGQLANDPKAIEQLKLGGVDFTVSATGSYATDLKTLNLTALPFLVDSYEQGWALYDTSPWMKAQFAKLPAKGYRMLATWEAGFRSFTTKGPLNSPADAKGKKMRVYPNDMLRWTMEAIGFDTVVMPVTEVYLAIQQGTVWGQENPVDTIKSLRFYEVAPYITLTRHIYSPLPMAISENTWQSLSDDEKTAVQKAADDAATYSRELVRGSEEKQLQEMEAAGATVTRPDIAPFRKAADAVYTRARAEYGDDVDALLSDAAKIRKEMPAN